MSLTGAGPVDKIEPSSSGFNCEPPRDSIPASGAFVHSIGLPSRASVLLLPFLLGGVRQRVIALEPLL